LAAVAAGVAPIRMPHVEEADDLEADLDDAAGDENEHLAYDTGLTPEEIEGDER
jgi:hypothetical protein